MINRIVEIFNNKFDHDFLGFLKHSKNYISADLFTKGLSIISIPIFTRLLIPEEYGILAIFSSFVAIFTIIFGLGIKGAVTRYYYEKKEDFNRFYGSNLSFIVLWSILLGVILYFFRETLNHFLKISLEAIYIGIGVVVFSTTFNIYQAYLQASKKSEKIAKINVTQAVTTLIIAIIITLLLHEKRFYGKMVAQLVVWLLFFIYSIWSILKISKINFRIKYIQYSLIFGVPVVFHLLSQYILSSFDQIIINQLVGIKETGLYSFAYKVGMIQNLVSMAMLRAWTPMLYERLREKNFLDIEKLVKKYSKIIYFLALSLILFSKEIVMILAEKKYYEALDIVPVVVISYVFFFLYTMYVSFAFYHKKTYLIAPFTVIAGLINIGLNYLLIPKYGYQVAAWTTLISYACLFIFHYCNARFIIKPEWITSLKVLLPNFGILLLFVVVYYYITSFVPLYSINLLMKLFLLSSLFYIYFGNYLRRIRGKNI